MLRGGDPESGRSAVRVRVEYDREHAAAGCDGHRGVGAAEPAHHRRMKVAAVTHEDVVLRAVVLKVQVCEVQLRTAMYYLFMVKNIVHVNYFLSH